MLTLVLATLLLQGDRPNWSTENTSVFRPLVRREVAIAADGRVFIVDREHSTILAYGADGTFVRKIGTKGQGPGELMMPTWLWLAGDRLYVEDDQNATLSVFDLQGTFQKRSRLPAGDHFQKCAQGWCYGNWDSTSKNGQPNSSLFIADEGLEKTIVLHSWPTPKEATAPSGRGDGKVVLPFNPATDEPQLAVAKDGKLAFFIPQGSDDLHIFDLAAKQLVKVVKNDNPPIRFNPAWGDQKLADINQTMPEAARKVIVFQKQYPSHFPLVNDLFVLPDGSVAVKLWTAWLDKQTRFLLFDRQGKSVRSTYSDEAIGRVFGEVGNLAYLSAYDSDDEEGVLVVLPKTAVNAYVKAHPIDYRGITGDSVITMD